MATSTTASNIAKKCVLCNFLLFSFDFFFLASSFSSISSFVRQLHETFYCLLTTDISLFFNFFESFDDNIITVKLLSNPFTDIQFKNCKYHYKAFVIFHFYSPFLSFSPALFLCMDCLNNVLTS